MKFATVQKGIRAERRVTLPGFEGAPALLLRPLNGLEEEDVLRQAFEYARRPGNEKPDASDELYELGVMLHTLAISCLDTDSPQDARTAFFDGGIDQIRLELPRDTIHYLYQQHSLWQDECSPYVRRLSLDEVYAKALEVASSEDDSPFTSLSPATRWIFTRTLATLLLDSRELKSASGAPSPSA